MNKANIINEQFPGKNEDQFMVNFYFYIQKHKAIS